jgi:hypothetical protein
MSYITPVTDRTYQDIVNETVKGYFNVLDWTRIYSNSLFVHDYIAGLLGITIPFTTIATPTRATIPTATDLNAMLANINAIAAVTGLPVVTIADLFIPCTWFSGFESTGPSYIDVNFWEQQLDSLLTLEKVAANCWVHSGVGNAGLLKLNQQMFRQGA